MRKPPGRIKRKLAQNLQRDFPDLRGVAITWSAEHIYEAKGYWRIAQLGLYRWSASAKFASGNQAMLVDSYHTCTDCSKAKKLERNENEISPKDLQSFLSNNRILKGE